MVQLRRRPNLVAAGHAVQWVAAALSAGPGGTLFAVCAGAPASARPARARCTWGGDRSPRLASTRRRCPWTVLRAQIS